MSQHKNNSADSFAIHRAGTRALLVDLPGLDEVMTWHAALQAQPLKGQLSAIAAASTVLLEFDSPRRAREAIAALEGFSPTAGDRGQSREVTIDVVYDGEDLASTAEHLGISSEELIRRHGAQAWMAAFGGFAPGFTYCVPTDGGENFEWSVPRRANPRTAVPTGAVALAGEFSAVYPRQSPGGWQLIGHTETPMWDATAADPALLAPGDTVFYRAVREAVELSSSATSAQAGQAPVPGRVSRPVATLDSVGLLSLVQDLGRPGHGDIGVTSSGALDRASARAANAAVGNESAAAVVENIGGLKITAGADVAVAVTGAAATVTQTHRANAQDANVGAAAGAAQSTQRRLAEPIALLAGDTLTIAPTGEGARHYLAIRGGISADTVLDSAATDVLSGMGPAPLEEGNYLKIGKQQKAAVNTSVENPATSRDVAGAGAGAAAQAGKNHAQLRCVLGPRQDWFSSEAIANFLGTAWEVTGQSNRIGLRMSSPDGVTLERERQEELASEGMLSGSVQVPPNGLPVLFLADHPVTGGYPVIATVLPEDLDKAGQLPPGATVNFRAVDPDTLEELDINPVITPEINADTAQEA